MSRTKQRESSYLEGPKNPATKFMTFKNVKEKEKLKSGKEVEVFNRIALEWTEKDENGDWQKITSELPMEFAILDKDYTMFRGFNKETNTNVYSNEVKDRNEIINIRNKNGVLFSFTLAEYFDWDRQEKKYSDKAKEVRKELKDLNAKEHKSVYIALKENGEIKLANLQLRGMNLKGKNFDWKDPIAAKEAQENPTGFKALTKFERDGFLYKNWIKVDSWFEEETELGTFGIADFKLGDKITPEESDILNDLDTQLQEYLDAYKSKPVEEEEEEMIENETDY